jgi:hypothetical protein
MNLLFHYLRKDFRYIRGWLFLTLLVSAGVLWFPTVPLEDRVSQISWLALIRDSGWLMLILTIGRLIQLDAPFRGGACLRTKPVPLSALIYSKILIALALIIPMAMCECLMLLMLDLNPGAISLLLIFCENLLVLSGIAAVAMALAIRQETFGKWLSSMLIWVSAIGVASFGYQWFQKARSLSDKPEWSFSFEYLKSSQMIMAQVVALVGALICILAFVRSRRHETISKILGLTAICAAATWLFWPLNFVETFVLKQRVAAKSEWPDQTKLKFSFSNPPDSIMPKKTLFIDGIDNGITDHNIRGWYRLERLSNGWATSHDAYESELKLANGRVIRSHESIGGPVRMVGILPSLGIKSTFGNLYSNPSYADLAKFKLADAADAMSGATLKGQLHIPIKRPILLQRIPLKVGLSARVANNLISITKVENLGDEISFRLVVQTPLIELRGGWQEIWTDRFEYFVINAARGECLEKRGGGENNPHFGHLSVRNLDFSRMALQNRYDHKQIPPDWLDGAELLIVGEEYGGTYSHSFQFSDINLSEQR